MNFLSEIVFFFAEDEEVCVYSRFFPQNRRSRLKVSFNRHVRKCTIFKIPIPHISQNHFNVPSLQSCSLSYPLQVFISYFCYSWHLSLCASDSALYPIYHKVLWIRIIGVQWPDIISNEELNRRPVTHRRIAIQWNSIFQDGRRVGRSKDTWLRTAEEDCGRLAKSCGELMCISANRKR